MMLAAQDGGSVCLQLLLEASADLNLQNNVRPVYVYMHVRMSCANTIGGNLRTCTCTCTCT